MIRIAVIGTGYVGLTAAIGLADFGSKVVGLDINPDKINDLRQGKVPIYENGIKEVLDKNVKADRLSFSTDIDAGIARSDIIFIGVGTPPQSDGKADLRAVFNVAATIGRNLNGYKIIVTKSTVPVGTNEKIKEVIAENNLQKADFDVVSNPEFLREGRALYDFLHPDRVVLGMDNSRPLSTLQSIYRPLYLNEVPFVITDLRTAEVIKYAANCFLATKVAFINEMARLCDTVGANVQTVAYAMGKDNRIGPKFLHPSPGYGGSCFPKDTLALAALSHDRNISLQLVGATISSNEQQKKYAVEKVARYFSGHLAGIKLAVLGLAFKAETDDIRDSPSVTIVNLLLEAGAEVSVYDPQAMDNARGVWGDRVRYAADEYEAVCDAKGVLIVTEWNQFRNLDISEMLNRMAGKGFFDFRNIYKRHEVEALGADYVGMGT